MCCILEIGLVVWGIVILVKGEVKLSSEKTVRGIPAYVIGGLLAGTVPLVFAIAFVYGFFMAMGGQQALEGNPAQYVWIDILVVLLVVVSVLIIGLVYAETGVPKKRKSTKRRRRPVEDDEYEEDYDTNRDSEDDDDYR